MNRNFETLYNRVFASIPQIASCREDGARALLPCWRGGVPGFVA
jgi:hypothetical protein